MTKKASKQAVKKTEPALTESQFHGLDAVETAMILMRKYKVTDYACGGITLKMSPIGFQEAADKRLEEVVKKFEEKSGMSKEEFDEILFHSAN